MEQSMRHELDLTLLDWILKLSPQERLTMNDTYVREMLQMRARMKPLSAKTS